ncbi:metal transporter CNNM4-like [Buteo buteo]|uniref:metal transporter CNNM4-like n=1 Tax=Buteo buteo TaxID=30397 RepID=UPI003EB9CF10
MTWRSEPWGPHAHSPPAPSSSPTPSWTCGTEDVSPLRKADGAAAAKLSTQLPLTAQRFPVRELELFSPVRISEKALLRLLSPPGVIQELKFENNTSSQSTATSSSSCRAAWRWRSGRRA